MTPVSEWGITRQEEDKAETEVLFLQAVDAEKHPAGYILEGSTPVAQEQKEQEQNEKKDGNAAAEPAPGKPGASTADGEVIDEAEVIDLMDDDEDEQPKVGGKRKLSDGAGPSTSTKMQKNDDEIIELD